MAVLFELARVEFGIGSKDFVLVAFGLNVSGGLNSFLNQVRGFLFFLAREFFDGNFRDRYVKIDAVDDRAGDFFAVSEDLGGETFAAAFFGAKVATRTWIGSGDKNKAGGVAHGA